MSWKIIAFGAVYFINRPLDQNAFIPLLPSFYLPSLIPHPPPTLPPSLSLSLVTTLVSLYSHSILCSTVDTTRWNSSFFDTLCGEATVLLRRREYVFGNNSCVDCQLQFIEHQLLLFIASINYSPSTKVNMCRAFSMCMYMYIHVYYIYIYIIVQHLCTDCVWAHQTTLNSDQFT